MFMHFGICTFAACEHNTGDPNKYPATLFNPSDLDTDQWAATAAAMGAAEICLSVVHEGGFTLWPSKQTPYGVQNATHWRGGNGDVVKDFVASCRKYAIKPCFYMAPPHNGYLLRQKLPPDVYMEKVSAMLEELLTNYGEVHRLWWDHWCTLVDVSKQGTAGSNSTQYAHWIAKVRALQPKALILPGPDGTLADVGEINPGVYPLWNSVQIPASPPNQAFQCNPNPSCQPCKQGGGAGYRSWLPVESDGTIQGCPLCKSHFWFWNGPPKAPPGQRVLTATELWQKYLRTVGRGANFIMNLPPNATGQFPPEFVEEVTSFGAAVNRTFSRPIMSVGVHTAASIPLACTPGGGGAQQQQHVVLNFTAADLGEAVEFDMIVTTEDNAKGQRIASYTVEVYVAGQEEGTEWQLLPANGKTVGHKVIDVLPFPIQTFPVPTAVEAVRFTCTGAAPGAGDVAYLRSFAVYKSSPPAA